MSRWQWFLIVDVERSLNLQCTVTTSDVANNTSLATAVAPDAAVSCAVRRRDWYGFVP